MNTNIEQFKDKLKQASDLLNQKNYAKAHRFLRFRLNWTSHKCGLMGIITFHVNQ